MPKMPRWSAVLPALALAGLTATAGAAHAQSAAYQQRADEWLAAQPPGTPPGNFRLIDGTYKGEAVNAAAQDGACPVARPGTIDIGDRRLIFPYLPNVTFIAPVQADGSLTARILPPPPSGPVRVRANPPPMAPIASLDGRIADGWLEFTARAGGCESHYRLRWTM